jgi:hypothetical protein
MNCQTQLNGWLDNFEGPMNLFHLLYMGYDIVMKFVDAY